MIGATTSQLTKRALEAEGWTVEVVEHRVPHRASVTKDLFGFADLLAVKAGEVGALFVQCTSVDHISHRLQKIKDEPRARTVLLSGNRILLVGWRPIESAPGERARWAEKRRWIQIEDLPPL